MNNTVVLKSLLTGIFLVLMFLPALEVNAFGQSLRAAKTPSVTSAKTAMGAVAGNQTGDEAVATEELATVANNKITTGATVSSQIAGSYVCDDCCGPKFYQSELWSNPFAQAFKTDPAKSPQRAINTPSIRRN